MSEGFDGRQTRPTNDVGRSDGRAERAPVDGRGTFAEWPIYAKAAAWQLDNAQKALVSGWPETASRFIRAAQEWLEAGQGLSRSEAPHGEAPRHETPEA